MKSMSRLPSNSETMKRKAASRPGVQKRSRKYSVHNHDPNVQLLFNDEQDPTLYWSDTMVAMSEMKITLHFTDDEEVQIGASDICCVARVSDTAEPPSLEEDHRPVQRQQSMTFQEQHHVQQARTRWFRDLSVTFTISRVSVKALTLRADESVGGGSDSAPAANENDHSSSEAFSASGLHSVDGFADAVQSFTRSPDKPPCKYGKECFRKLTGEEGRKHWHDFDHPGHPSLVREKKRRSIPSTSKPVESVTIAFAGIYSTFSMQREPQELNNIACSVDDAKIFLKDSPTRLESMIREYADAISKDLNEKRYSFIRPKTQPRRSYAGVDQAQPPPFKINGRLRRAKLEIFPLPSLKVSYSICEVEAVNEHTDTRVRTHGLCFDSYRTTRTDLETKHSSSKIEREGGKIEGQLLRNLERLQSRTTTGNRDRTGGSIPSSNGAAFLDDVSISSDENDADIDPPRSNSITKSSSTVTTRVNIRDHRIELSSGHVESDSKFHLSVDRKVDLPSVSVLDIDSRADASNGHRQDHDLGHGESQKSPDNFNRVVAILIDKMDESFSMDAISQMIGAHDTLVQELDELADLVTAWAGKAEAKRSEVYGMAASNAIARKIFNSTKMDIVFHGAKIAVKNALTTQKRQHGFVAGGEGIANVLAFYTGTVHVAMNTIADHRKDNSETSLDVQCPPDGHVGPGLFFGKVNPDYNRTSLHDDIEVIKIYLSLALTGKSSNPFDKKISMTKQHRELYLHINDPTLVVPWQTVAVAWSFSLDLQRARSKWRQYQKETDEHVIAASAAIRAKMKGRMDKVRSNSEFGTFTGAFRIHDGQARFICMPRMASNTSTKDTALDVFVVNLKDTGVDLSAQDGGNTGSGKGEFSQFTAYFVRISPDDIMGNRRHGHDYNFVNLNSHNRHRTIRKKWANGTIGSTTETPSQNMITVPAGSMSVRQSYETYGSAAGEFTLKTGKSLISVAAALGRTKQQKQNQQQTSVTFDINSQFGGHVCVMAQTLRRVSESIAVNTNLANIATSDEVDQVMEELQTQNFILEFLERQGATPMSISYARQHARVLEQALQRTMMKEAAFQRRASTFVSNTEDEDRRSDNASDSEESTADLNVGTDYAYSLDIIISRSVMNMHFAEDTAAVSNLTKANIQGSDRRMSHYHENVQRSFRDDLGDEEMNIGSSFNGGRDRILPSPIALSPKKSMESIPFPEVGIVAASTPPSVTALESHTNHTKRSACIRIRLSDLTIEKSKSKSLTLSPRILDFIDATVKEYNAVLSRRSSTGFGASLLSKQMSLSTNGGDAKESAANFDVDSSRPVSTVVITHISEAEITFSGTKDTKVEGRVTTPATKILISSTYGVGEKANTGTVQNITASFKGLSVRIAEKATKSYSRSPVNGGHMYPGQGNTPKPALQATITGLDLHATRILPKQAAKGSEKQTTTITTIVNLKKVYVLMDLTKYQVIKSFQNAWYDKERFLGFAFSRKEPDEAAEHNIGTDNPPPQHRGSKVDPWGWDVSDTDSDSTQSSAQQSTASRRNGGSSPSGSKAGGSVRSSRMHPTGRHGTERLARSVSDRPARSISSKISKGSKSSVGSSEFSTNTPSFKNVMIYLVDVDEVVVTTNLDQVLGSLSVSARGFRSRGQLHFGKNRQGGAVASLKRLRIGDAEDSTNGEDPISERSEEAALIKGEILIQPLPDQDSGLHGGITYAVPERGLRSLTKPATVMLANGRIGSASGFLQSRHIVVLNLNLKDSNFQLTKQWKKDWNSAADDGIGDSDDASSLGIDSRLSSETELNTGTITIMLVHNTIPTVTKLVDRLQKVFKVTEMGDGAEPWDDQATSAATALPGRGKGTVRVVGKSITVVGFERDFVEANWWLFKIADFGATFELTPRAGVQTLKMEIGEIGEDLRESLKTTGVNVYSMTTRESAPHPDPEHLFTLQQWREWCKLRFESTLLPPSDLHPREWKNTQDPILKIPRTMLSSKMDVSSLEAKSLIECKFETGFPDQILVTLNAHDLNLLKMYVEKLIEESTGSSTSKRKLEREKAARAAESFELNGSADGATLDATADDGGGEKGDVQFLLEPPNVSGDASFVFKPDLKPFSAGAGNITVEWILEKVKFKTTDLQKTILGGVYKILHVPLALYVAKVETVLHAEEVDTLGTITELKREAPVYRPLKIVKHASSGGQDRPSSPDTAGTANSSRSLRHLRPGGGTSPSIPRRVLKQVSRTNSLHSHGSISRATSAASGDSFMTATSSPSQGLLSPNLLFLPSRSPSALRRQDDTGASAPPLNISTPLPPSPRTQSSLRVEEKFEGSRSNSM
jgi:hypothetical protein